MEKKTYNEMILNYNKQIKELQQEAKTITSKDALLDFNKRVDNVLTEKLKLEKKQLEELKQIEKNRIAKSTNRVSAQLRKERTHRLCVLGGLVEQQLGDTVDVELYEQIQEFLSVGYVKKYFNKWLEVKAAATSAQPVDNPTQ